MVKAVVEEEEEEEVKLLLVEGGLRVNRVGVRQGRRASRGVACVWWGEGEKRGRLG